MTPSAQVNNPQPTIVIDSHQHFWDRSLKQFDNSWQESEPLKKICRSYLPADLAPHLKQSGVDKSIFVQTQHNVLENDWALELAEKNDLVAGVVGWVDLTSPSCPSSLESYCSNPKFVGIRHVTQDEPDPDFIVRPDVDKGLSTLESLSVPFDLLFYSHHLKHAATVADRHPNLPLVIDHLSKPDIKAGELEVWAKELKQASERPNVFCKLSGMVTEADWNNWTIEDVRPFFETAIECFGSQRMMFGSDWPVCELAANYEQVIGLTRSLISSLSVTEQSQIMGTTAHDFYSLDSST